MNPPNVYELTMPNSQRIKSKTAIVQSIDIPFLVAVCLSSQQLQSNVSRPCCCRYPVKSLVEAQSRFTCDGVRTGCGHSQ